MKKKIVIKFSGKVFAMENVKLLKDYARFLVKISKTYQPIIVAGGGKIARHYITPVSYTHLTLPTIYSE